MAPPEPPLHPDRSPAPPLGSRRALVRAWAVCTVGSRVAGAFKTLTPGTALPFLGAFAGCASPARRAADLPAADAAEVVMLAMSYLDTPYRRGGLAAETGFDCSGFTRHVFERGTGLVLPRTAAEQARHPALREIGADALRPGDLVFFNTLQRPFSHVGLYTGDGRFVHAPRPGTRVRSEEMRARYWAERFDGARRATLAPRAAAG
ncbi:MAG: C40 family peptidase [Rubrivivax sp.]|nr:C40 family peptidase [Rubrivivax sp.]